MNLDIFRRAFANGTIAASDVFTAIWLEDGPRSLRELAGVLRVSTRTVQRSLGRLARAGLVEKRTYNKREPGRDEWELTAMTKMALDRSGSLAISLDIENRDRIDLYDTSDDHPDPKQETLAIKVADCLGLPQSLGFIREAILSVPEMAPDAVMLVARRVASYIWREDGTANRRIENPAAYFAKSLKKEWERIQQYFRAKEEAGLQGQYREIHVQDRREDNDREQVVTIPAAYRDTNELDRKRELALGQVAQEETEVVVGPGGKVLLVPRRRDKPEIEACQGKRIPGMFASLANMLKRRVTLDAGVSPTFGVAAAAAT